MRDHVKILAILNIVFGSGGVIAGLGLLLLFFSGYAAALGVSALAFLGILGYWLLVFSLIFFVPAIVVGIGLLKFRPWARILTIVLSALNLLNVPLGTAVGVYGLWVLLNSETEQLFRSTPAVQPRQPFAS